MFEPGEVAKVYAEENWRVPCTIVVDGDGLSRSFWPHAAGVVKLVVKETALAWQAWMSFPTIDNLVGTLAGIREAHPEGVASDAEEGIEVPLAEPETPVRGEVVWRVGSRVRLIHRGRDEVTLQIAEVEEEGDRGRATLDEADCWTLLRALVSVRAWQERLDVAFARAADVCREGVGGSGERWDDLPTIFAGQAAKTVALGSPKSMPCLVTVADGDFAVETMPGTERVIALEAQVELVESERTWLAQRLGGILDVIPQEWTSYEFADVPYLAPVGGDGRQLVWRITDALSLVEQEGVVYLMDRSDGGGGAKVSVSLDCEQARRLVRALVSVEGWQEEAAACAAEAVVTHRLDRLGQLQRDRIRAAS